MEKLLYTKDPSLRVEGFQKVEELPEELERAVVLVDIDTVGVSSLPDLKEGETYRWRLPLKVFRATQ